MSAFPRLPDWLIYLAVAVAIIAVALARHEDLAAPEPPPPVVGAGEVPLPSNLPFDRAYVVRIPKTAEMVGTAFSVSDKGVWLTAFEAARSCRRPVLVIAEGRGVEAGVEIMDEGGVTVLTTAGGAPPIPVARGTKIMAGQRGFVPGYPMGRPGEATGRLIHKTKVAGRGRGADEIEALAWAESGRTESLGADLAGIAGAPVLDEQGRAIGVLLEDSPRRGTLYSAGPKAMALAIAKARTEPVTAPRSEPVTVDNYYRVADQMRRDLSVVPVKCLRR